MLRLPSVTSITLSVVINREVMPVAVVAVDLLDSGDPRSRRTGLQIINQLLDPPRLKSSSLVSGDLGQVSLPDDRPSTLLNPSEALEEQEPHVEAARSYRAQPLRIHPIRYNIWYQSRWRFLMSITASEARRRLFPLIDEVNDDGAAVEIVAKSNRAYLVPAAEYEALKETAHLLRSPANMRRLISSYQHALEGRQEIHDLIDPDEQQ